MPETSKTREAVTVSLPIGTKAKAKELGVNISFHASKAVQAEINRIEQQNKKDLGFA